ncbi:hypothetical protein BU23DRAFT_333170 [Bimuria novae-zelandiae CBS 107.79]|uniref:Uncharacterized protein n=1 Tax=Bimuria novae-zelandiae CBS 107.79 TaxID=1447943 RepID=A0A6A5UT53_9PLEO|nr:hypothetical protein BU23DRAFT_333170 [Bimuria novae-zelandiae CBS 107.79]
MSEIEKSFLFLHDNIPKWSNDVTDIETKIVAMQSELSRIPVSRSLPFKKRTGSIASIRNLDAIQEEPDAPSSEARQSEPNNRKRKEPSLFSGQQSGPAKLRSRTMVVVNYDGQIQTVFEQLVRAIGTGRNMLRKGKMAAKLDAMAALAGSSDEDDEDDTDAIMSKIGYRHRRGFPSMRARGMIRQVESSGTPTERFDTADKALEEAQALCERAAHQSLREGDCRKELDGVRKNFDHVMDIAKGEVARHGAQQLEVKEREQPEEANQPPKPETPTAFPLPGFEKEPIRTVIPPTLSTYNNGATIVDIEIDDEEDDADLNFVMPPIRLTSRV